MLTPFRGRKATPVGAISRAPAGPARSKNPDMHGTSMRENRETLPTSDTKLRSDRLEKAMNHNSNMNVGRESDGRVLPAKCPNNGGSTSPAEGMEGRRPRPRYKAGETRWTGCIVCGKQQSGINDYDSPRYCITYPSRFSRTASTP